MDFGEDALAAEFFDDEFPQPADDVAPRITHLLPNHALDVNLAGHRSAPRDVVDDAFAQPILEGIDRRSFDVEIHLEGRVLAREPAPWNTERRAASRTEPAVKSRVPTSQSFAEPREQRDRADFHVRQTRRLVLAQLENDPVDAAGLLSVHVVQLLVEYVREEVHRQLPPPMSSSGIDTMASTAAMRLTNSTTPLLNHPLTCSWRYSRSFMRMRNGNTPTGS